MDMARTDRKSLTLLGLFMSLFVLCSFFENETFIRNVALTRTVLLNSQECEDNVTKWMYNDVLIFVDRVAVQRQFEDSVYLLKNYTLLITSLHGSHEGVYTCLCGKETVKRYALVVEVTPTLTLTFQGLNESSSEVNIEANKKYTIICQARNARPAVQLSWYINREEVNQTQITFLPTQKTRTMSTITFDSISQIKIQFPYVNGTISCTSKAQRTFGEMRVNLRFRTFVLPKVFLAINDEQAGVDVYIPAQEESVFSCHALNSRPAVKLSWLVNNKPIVTFPGITVVDITTTSNLKGSTTFDTISTLKYYPTIGNGTVSCIIVHNSSGTSEVLQINWLSYVVPVMFYTVNGQSNVTEIKVRGQEYARVTCHAIGARPKTPRLIWLINNQSTHGSQDSADTTSITYVKQNTFDVATTLTFKPQTSKGTITCISRGIGNVTNYIIASYQTDEYIPTHGPFNFILYIGLVASAGVFFICSAMILVTRRGCTDPQARCRMRFRNDATVRTTQTFQKHFEGNFQSGAGTSENEPNDTYCAAGPFAETESSNSKFTEPQFPEVPRTFDTSGYCPIADVETDVYSEPTRSGHERRMYQGKDMCLIMTMKLGRIYNRWMGTITKPTGTVKCVVFSTLTDQMLTTRRIQWDKYVKRLLDLPTNKSLLAIEGICVDDTQLYLIHEHVVCETLETRIESRRDRDVNQMCCKSLWISEVEFHLANLLEGMEIIHSYGLLHPGLTARKILVTNQGVCKLYDFCLPQDVFSKLTALKSQGKYTNKQLPPEALQRNEYVQESDVWCFAAVVWSMVSKESVDVNPENENISFEATISKISELWPEEYSLLRNEDLFRCWMFNYLLRPSINTLRKSFKEIFSSKVVSTISETSSEGQADLYLPMNGPSNRELNETIA